jgi:hypothetical protein
MKESYIKAIKVINSCKTSKHVMGTYNYIWNFRRLFANESGCKELTSKLHNRCHKKRKMIGEKNE